MTEWLSKEDKKQLVVQAMERWNAGFVGGPTNDVLKAKMELEAIEAATRAANASERNAKYMGQQSLRRFPPLRHSSL
jgi:hypothetical protein